MIRLMSILIAMTFLAMPASLQAQKIEYVNSTLWSGVHEVKVVGNYAYCAFTNGLVILDVSNPASPSFMSKLYLQGTGYHVSVIGHYAYFNSGPPDTKIIDVSDPADPKLIGNYKSPASDIFYDTGKFAYLADLNGLQILDVSNPANPTLKSKYDIADGVSGVYVAGHYAFLTNGKTMFVLDISKLNDIALRGSCNFPRGEFGAGSRIFESNGKVYIADGDRGLITINVADPANPVQIANYDSLGIVNDIHVSGNYVFMVGYMRMRDRQSDSSGLRVLDISDSSNPRLVSSYDVPDYSHNIFVYGNFAYITSGTGVVILDISDPTNLRHVGDYKTPQTISAVALSGNYAYVATGPTGLSIIDISKRENPIMLDKFNSIGFASDVFISGNFAYVADDSLGLEIFDISNPAAPAIVGRCDSIAHPRDIYASGDYAYIPNNNGDSHVINVSDPKHPTVTDIIYGRAADFFVSGNYNYVLDGRFGMKIYNITDPINSVLIGSYDSRTSVKPPSSPSPVKHSGGAERLYISGNYAYIEGGKGTGLQVIDISNPANPVLTGVCDTGVGYRGLKVSGHYAYLVGQGSNERHAAGALDIIDISNASNPKLAASYNLPWSARDVSVSGDYVYVADGFSLMILKFNP